MLINKRSPCHSRLLLIKLFTFILVSSIFSQTPLISSTRNPNTTPKGIGVKEDTATLTAGFDPDWMEQLVEGQMLYSRDDLKNKEPNDETTTSPIETVDQQFTFIDSANENSDSYIKDINRIDPTVALEPVSESTESAYLSVDYNLYIAANKIKLRAAPLVDAETVANLKFGDKVRCRGESPDWLQVTFAGKTGYLEAKYTSRLMVFKSVKEVVYVVKTSKLNLRSKPSTDGKILATLKTGNKLTRIGVGSGWSKVKTAAGKIGYVSTKYVTTKAPSSVASDGPTYSGDAGKIVELAYSALGVRYVYGHASLTAGFDCSGLTSWAYKQIGINIPRSSCDYLNAGKEVAYSNIKPGDVLCMDTESGDGQTSITHVGIYVGGGNMIHASSSRGKVVLQEVSQYLAYRVKLITVRRFLK
jgi:cell wall-associated NlpC family hydrolase